MKKYVAPACLYAMLASAPAQAFESFVVREIHVDGLQRVSEGTVFNYLPFQLGDRLTDQDSTQIIRALYQTGFFQKIDLVRDNETLIIKVVERPVIGEMTISGNDEIKTAELLESLKGIGLSEGRTYDEALTARIAQSLEQTYYNLGYYAVKVKTTATPQDRNRTSLQIDIQEGDVARIKRIDFIGAEHFSSKQLKADLTLKETAFWPRWTKKDRYSKQRLEADLEALQSYYFDRGYLNFQVEDTQVSVSDDKADIYVNIMIFEGEPYRVGKITITGETILDTDELRALIETESGDIFSRQRIIADAGAIRERYGVEGYAFTEVNPIPFLDEEKHIVDIEIMVEPSNRYYVNEITFTGNTKTQDHVLRREMVQLEGSLLNTEQIEASKRGLDKTGFFSEVNVSTQPVSSNEVRVNYDVEETSSGHIAGGMGYSTAEGVIFNASVSNRNVFGSGESLDLDFNRSSTYSTYSLGYNNPYYTIDGVSRGFNLYYTKTDPGETTELSDYYTDVVGTSVNYGMPLTKNARLNYGLGLRDTDLHVGADVPAEITRFIEQNGHRYLEFNLTSGWSYNSFDRYIFPTKGWRHVVSASLSTPGSDLQYYKLSYNTQLYQPLPASTVGMLSWTVGYGDGYGKTEVMPFYQNFFGGGLRSVRGYGESSLGPRDSLSNPFGGNLMVNATAQLAFGRFFGEPFKSVRPAVFLDMGQVYTTADKHFTNAGVGISRRNPNGLRYSAGAALTWLSPMGPLEFSLGYPLQRKKGDDLRPFNFSIGTYF